MSNNLKLKLSSAKDRDGETFYFAKLEGPFLIDCREGVTFLIFLADKGQEQLQIALMDKRKNNSEEKEQK